jgi:hypothetical protein
MMWGMGLIWLIVIVVLVLAIAALVKYTVIAAIGKQIKTMRPHRIFAPDLEVLGREALLSGILCRLQGYEKDGKLRALQDCVLFFAGADARPGGADRECRGLRYPAPAHPDGAGAVLPPEMRPLRAPCSAACVRWPRIDSTLCDGMLHRPKSCKSLACSIDGSTAAL